MAEAERPESSPKTRHTAQELKFQFEVFWIMCLGAECRGSCGRNECVNPFPVALGRLSDAGYSLTSPELLGMSVETHKIVPKIATPRYDARARVWGPHYRVSTAPGHHERFRVGSTAESGLRIYTIIL